MRVYEKEVDQVLLEASDRLKMEIREIFKMVSHNVNLDGNENKVCLYDSVLEIFDFGVEQMSLSLFDDGSLNDYYEMNIKK